MAEITEHAQLAENLGFDSVWAGESHQTTLKHGHLPSPLLGLAAIAHSTSRIRLGTGILLLPLYNPLRLAEDAAVLDCISGGRLVLGFGLGGKPNLRAYGVTIEQSVGIFEESIELMVKLWREPEVTFEGRYFRCERASVTPKPLQKGGPPILIGGGAPASAERASRLGSGWIGASNYAKSRISSLVKQYRESTGKRGGRVVVNRVIYVGEDGTRAKSAALPYFRQFVEWYASRGALSIPGLKEHLDDGELTSLMEELAIIGSPEDCVRMIGRYQAIGVDQLNLRVRLPGMTAEETERALRMISAEIFPRFL